MGKYQICKNTPTLRDRFFLQDKTNIIKYNIEDLLPIYKASEEYSRFTDGEILHLILQKITHHNIAIIASYNKMIAYDPSDPRTGEWLNYTAEEILSMKAEGITVPDEVVEWAFSQEKFDEVSYVPTDGNVSELTETSNVEALDCNGNNSFDTASSKALTDYGKAAEVKNEQLQANAEDIRQKNDELNAENEKFQNTQREITDNINKKTEELKTLEDRVINGETLSDSDVAKYNKLSDEVKTENRAIANQSKNLNDDIDELLKSMDELNSDTKIAESLSQNLDKYVRTPSKLSVKSLNYMSPENLNRFTRSDNDMSQISSLISVKSISLMSELDVNSNIINSNISTAKVMGDYMRIIASGAVNEAESKKPVSPLKVENASKPQDKNDSDKVQDENSAEQTDKANNQEQNTVENEQIQNTEKSDNKEENSVNNNTNRIADNNEYNLQSSENAETQVTDVKSVTDMPGDFGDLFRLNGGSSILNSSFGIAGIQDYLRFNNIFSSNTNFTVEDFANSNIFDRIAYNNTNSTAENINFEPQTAVQMPSDEEMTDNAEEIQNISTDDNNSELNVKNSVASVQEETVEEEAVAVSEQEETEEEPVEDAQTEMSDENTTAENELVENPVDNPEAPVTDVIAEEMPKDDKNKVEDVQTVINTANNTNSDAVSSATENADKSMSHITELRTKNNKISDFVTDNQSSKSKLTSLYQEAEHIKFNKDTIESSRTNTEARMEDLNNRAKALSQEVDENKVTINKFDAANEQDNAQEVLFADENLTSEKAAKNNVQTDADKNSDLSDRIIEIEDKAKTSNGSFDDINNSVKSGRDNFVTASVNMEKTVNGLEEMQKDSDALERTTNNTVQTGKVKSDKAEDELDFVNDITKEDDGSDYVAEEPDYKAIPTLADESRDVQEYADRDISVSDHDVDLESDNNPDNNTRELEIVAQKAVVENITEERENVYLNPLIHDTRVDTEERMAEAADLEITEIAEQDAMQESTRNTVKSEVVETMQSTLSDVGKRAQKKDTDNDKKHKMFTEFENKKRSELRKTVQKVSKARDVR